MASCYFHVAIKTSRVNFLRTCEKRPVPVFPATRPGAGHRADCATLLQGPFYERLRLRLSAPALHLVRYAAGPPPDIGDSDGDSDGGVRWVPVGGPLRRPSRSLDGGPDSDPPARLPAA